MLKSGDDAPNFTLSDQDGRPVSLSDFSGQTLVLFFYPKDDTPGCTKEACNIRDHYDAIKDTGAAAIGVSADDATSHTKFRAKFGLPYPLLSDPTHTMIERWGAWGEKKKSGKPYMGILRSTVIVDRQGIVMTVFPRVAPDEHGAEIAKYLREQT